MQILSASWVVPVAAPPLAGGRVAVDDGRCMGGPRGEPGQPEARPLDLGDGVLLPGLVNAHCHLELSHLAGKVDPARGFVSWVEEVVEKRPGHGREGRARGRAPRHQPARVHGHGGGGGRVQRA